MGWTEMTDDEVALVLRQVADLGDIGSLDLGEPDRLRAKADILDPRPIGEGDIVVPADASDVPHLVVARDGNVLWIRRPAPDPSGGGGRLVLESFCSVVRRAHRQRGVD